MRFSRKCIAKQALKSGLNAVSQIEFPTLFRPLERVDTQVPRPVLLAAPTDKAGAFEQLTRV